MGVGYPDEIEEYARMGVDMMDVCCLRGRDGMGCYLRPQGRLNIKKLEYAEDQGPIDASCGCMVAGGTPGLSAASVCFGSR